MCVRRPTNNGLLLPPLLQHHYPKYFSPRLNQTYVRAYTVFASNTLIVLLPTLCMIVSTALISREMVRTTRGTTVRRGGEPRSMGSRWVFVARFF